MTNVRIPKFPALPDSVTEDPELLEILVAAVRAWGQDLYQQLQRILIDINTNRQIINQPSRLPSVSAATLVTNVQYRAKTPGIVWCPDDVSGPVVAYADTTTMLWRRIDTNVAIAP